MQKKYQVIPRKYRPATFENMVGQENIVTTLKNALRLERVAHAYIFCGARGTGKTTLARLFAKALNCHRLGATQEPCNNCPSCIEIASGRSLDVLEIDGASNRGIDDIRQINETIGYAPSLGKYKIYIIDEVHMLTKEAFNALLKTLEEPPAHVKFFFATTESHKVLPTIISRCQRFDLSRIPIEMIVRKLAWIAQDLKVEAHREALYLIAENAEGSLRDAESLLDQILCHAEGIISSETVIEILGLMPKNAFFALDEAIEKGDLSFGFKCVDNLFATGKDATHFIEGLISHFRYHILIKLQSDEDPVKNLSEKERSHYLSMRSFYTLDQCLYILDFLVDCLQQFTKNTFKRISLEMLLLHLIRTRHRIPLEALVKRLSELETLISTSKTNPEKIPLKEEVVTPQISLEEKLIEAIKQKTDPQEIPPKESEINIEELSQSPLQPQMQEQNREPSCKADLEKNPVKEEVVIPQISLEEKLIEAIKQKIDKEDELPKESTEKLDEKVSASSLQLQNQEKQPAHPSKYDTIMRFAAVELEGIIKKD